MGDKYGSNMFDLLNEEPKKQKAQQKKENVPKADNKGKAAVAPAKKSGNNQGNKSQGQQSQGGRARGGEGRGRARGRGGRPEGRGRGNDNFPVDGENRQGNNNNRGKQVSRRQREDNFKRGDYGSPDADGRQKRPYDKFSHSAGSKRKQEKKGGAGAGNWGNAKKGEVEQDVPASEEEEKKENENEESKDKEGEAAEGDEEAKEESDDDIDYDAYLEKKKTEQEELSKLVQTDVRKVDAADYEGLKTLSKSSEESFVAPSGKKKGKKTANTPNGKSVKVDQVLDVRAPAGDNRRRGRQNRPNNQRSNKRNVNLTLDDDKDFPSLGGK